MVLVLHDEFLKERRDERFLLAISGGRDSVALFYSLLEKGYSNLILCHLHHGLRGEDSDKDADFVRELGKKNNLSVEIKYIEISSLSKSRKQSVELVARNERRIFFQECSEKHGVNKVLLAHHAEDQTETILFNLMRGSNGLKGMKVRSEHHLVEGDGMIFYRPLLEVRRSEIDGFLSERGISYREDASNAELTATRNRLRHEAIPLLCEIMGRDICPLITRAEKTQTENKKCLEGLIHEMELEDSQGRLFLPKVIDLSSALQLVILREFLKKQSVSDLNFKLLESCLSLLTDRKISKINLPGGKHLRRKEKRLFIE